MRNQQMYAVIEDSGRQFKVAEGEVIHIDLRQAEPGDTVQFDKVLFAGGETPRVGTPYLDGATVKAEVEEEVKGKKVVHYVFRRRHHNSSKKKGHRQRYLRVKITEIAGT